MAITYSTEKQFKEKDLAELFLSIGRESGRYPDKPVRGLAHSSHVISVWDNDRLVGLLRSLDDGENAFLLQRHTVRENHAL